MKKRKEWEIGVDVSIEDTKGLTKKEIKELDAKLVKAVAGVLTQCAIEMGEMHTELEITD